MPFDGLSAAGAPAAINTRKHTMTSRGSITGTSDETTPGIASRLGSARGAGDLGAAEIRQPPVHAKLTIFHVIRALRAARARQKALPKLRANHPLGGVPGAPEVMRAYASTYHSLPG